MNIRNFLGQAFYWFDKGKVHKRVIANWVWFFREINSSEGKTRASKISQQLLDLSSELGGDTYVSDGMFLWGREIGWINDHQLFESIKLASPTDDELRIIWRTHVLTWAASQARNVEGDFFEFGCFKGFSGFVVREFCKELFLGDQNRTYLWFDLFESQPNDKPRLMDHSESESFALNRAKRFNDTYVLKGDVRATFLNDSVQLKRKVAFAHFDLNNFAVEYEVIKQVLSQSQKGTVLVFDDFAMTPFIKQNTEYRKLLNQLSIPILELPTGQGVAFVL